MLMTERLILRPWRATDLEPFAALNADSRVMAYFPSLLTREESDQAAKRYQQKIEEKGWGFWAVSVMGGAPFIGMIGLNEVTFSAPFTSAVKPAVEIGWRLSFEHWGKGYAVEGAKKALEFAFDTLKLPEIVSFTTLENKRSRRVMEKIGMRYDPKEDFDHPKISEHSPLRRHALYRISSKEWRAYVIS